MFKELLAAEFAPFGVLSELQLNQLEGHYKVLTRWNARMNLTRISGLEDSVRLHYCESLRLAQFLPVGIHRIVDIGSGGGFPGVPVAIFRPECEITLVESHQRKAVFLREATRNFENLRVLATRAEDVVDRFDWMVSRAVAPGDVLKLNVAKNVALLIGREDAANLVGSSLSLPWGTGRVLFHVEHAN
jgi:16S rRNA (guanine527-N7)-methyltransferase